MFCMFLTSSIHDTSETPDLSGRLYKDAACLLWLRLYLLSLHFLFWVRLLLMMQSDVSAEKRLGVIAPADDVDPSLFRLSQPIKEFVSLCALLLSDLKHA